MSAFKTCEEYVISLVEEKENKVIELEETLNQSRAEVARLKGAIETLAKYLKVGFYSKDGNIDRYLDVSLWQNNHKEDFDRIVKAYNLNVPESEDEE